MDIDKEREKIGKFIKAGLLGMSFVLLVGCGVLYLPKAVKTFLPAKEEAEMPIKSVECSEKKIALSFNISGKNENINDILKVLKAHGIQGTFFVTGAWAASYPEDLKEIQKEGHDIGNFSTQHKKMKQLSEKQCIQEIQSAHNKVKELTGIQMNLFRAPYGEYNKEILEAADELNYYPIAWSIDSEDWKDYGIDAIVDQICNHPELKNGAIILCHNGTKFTAKALGTVIDTIQNKGFTFVKVSELIYYDDYEINENGRQQKEKVS